MFLYKYFVITLDINSGEFLGRWLIIVYLDIKDGWELLKLFNLLFNKHKRDDYKERLYGTKCFKGSNILFFGCMADPLLPFIDGLRAS
jgi:hypothetical protein